MKILMCKPTYYGLEYEINPWMNKKVIVNPAAAEQQWTALYNTIKKCGPEILLVDPVQDLPDIVFTANAGLYYKNKIILSHFRYPERRGEMAYYKQWFIDQGYEVLHDATQNPHLSYYEGEGDTLLAGEKIFAGYGFRTDLKFYEKNKILDKNQLILCELINPYFYHLDTCFCPLRENLGIWYPQAFSHESQKRMQEHMELIPVAEEEALCFCCNAIVIDNHVILPLRAPNIAKKLGELGFNTHLCDMDEFIKAGGACKCLTMFLE